MILLLNKVDKFRSLVKKYPIFLDENRKMGFDESCEYLKSMFDGLRPEAEDIFTHFTCAIKKFSVNILSSKVSELIVHENLAMQTIQ